MLLSLRGWPDAFDIYLGSLACTTCGRAVTVILSGMGSDGSAALQQLQAGRWVQLSAGRRADASMPDSAVRIGMMDYVGSPQEIACAILALPRLREPLL